MLDLLDQEALDIILSPEVIFSAVFTLAMFSVVHTLLSFLRLTGPLYTRMAEIEAHLSVMQANIPGKVARLAELRGLIQPLENDFRQIRTYHARLAYIERKAEEKELEKEKEEAEVSGRLVERRSKGLDRFI